MADRMIKEAMINEIIDNDFMDKDVSELIEDDFYIFHATQEKMYFYYKGFICIGNIYSIGNDEFTTSPVKIEYTSGTLQEWVNELTAKQLDITLGEV